MKIILRIALVLVYCFNTAQLIWWWAAVYRLYCTSSLCTVLYIQLSSNQCFSRSPGSTVQLSTGVQSQCTVMLVLLLAVSDCSCHTQHQCSSCQEQSRANMWREAALFIGNIIITCACIFAAVQLMIVSDDSCMYSTVHREKVQYSP